LVKAGDASNVHIWSGVIGYPLLVKTKDLYLRRMPAVDIEPKMLPRFVRRQHQSFLAQVRGALS
jgi:hypothetical protein